MRCILGLCAILTTAAPLVYAYQEPEVRTSVPNIQASGAASRTVRSVSRGRESPGIHFDKRDNQKKSWSRHQSVLLVEILAPLETLLVVL